MSGYLVVDDQTNMVINAIEWDGVDPYVELGCTIVPIPDFPLGVWTGWSLIDDQWIPPQEPETS